MAGNYDELQAVLRELLTNRFAPKPEYTRGLLGDGQGNVAVPGRPDKNYVRFNRGSTEFFQIFNVTVPAVNDWPVLIGELPWLPGLTQVVGTDWASYEQSGWGDNLGDTSPHAPTHEWPDGTPGADPVEVYLRAIVPLRAYALGTGSTTIYVNSYEYENTNGSGTVWGGLPGVDMQPVMSSLSTGTARLMGVYLNPGTNQLGVVTGASDIFTDASDPPSPQFPRGVIPVARIRTYGGQASIGEIDIRDARQPFGWIPTGTASAVGVWPNYDEIKLLKSDGTNVLYTTLTAAAAAASTGDLILVGPGSFAFNGGTLPTQVDLIGSGISITTITSSGETVAFTASTCTLKNFTLETNLTDTGRLTGMKLTGTCFLDSIEISANNFGSTGPSTALDMAGGRVVDCEIDGFSDTGSDDIGLIASSTVYVYSGFLSGSGSDVDTNTGGKIRLAGVQLVSGTVNAFVGNGTVDGAWIGRTNSSVNLPTDGYIDFDESASAPSNPATNHRRVYAKSDGIYGVDAAGTEEKLGGGWPFNNADGADDAITVHPSDTNADYTSIQSAHDNAAAGATILFSGNITEDVTLSKTLTLQGFNPETSVLIGTLTVSAAATLRDFKASETGTAASNYGIVASAAITAHNVEAEATGAGTGGNNAGWHFTAGSGSRLVNCKGTGSGNATNNYGLMADTAASDITIESGEWDGTPGGNFDADITSLRTDIDIHLIDAQCKNNTLRITGGLTGSAKTSTGEDAGFIVNNGTGAATMEAGRVGYIDANGDYNETSTEADVVPWCVVTVGNAALNKPAFVKNRGIAIVNYTGSAPSAGDLIITSATAGSVTTTSGRHYAMMAKALAAGSGGKVKVLLLTQTETIEVIVSTTSKVFGVNGHSGTSWASTINGAPSGAVITYNTPVTGNEDSIDVEETNQLGKLVLHNTTRTEEAFISSVDTGANTITVTDSADISGWSDTDAIQVDSPTATATIGGEHYYEIQIKSTEIPELARSILVRADNEDTGAANVFSYLTLFFADPANFIRQYNNLVANTTSSYYIPIAFVNDKILIVSRASGSGTKLDRLFVYRAEVAAP